MKVKEFCKVFDLEESGINHIKLMDYDNGAVETTYFDEGLLYYGKYRKYVSTSEWLIGEFGEYELEEGCFIGPTSRTFYAKVKRIKEEA